MSGPTAVEVAICTFRRPELSNALMSVTRQNLPEGVDLAILVVDNDREPSAEPMVREAARRSTVPIRYAHCPFGNISVARNGALDRAEAHYLAFLDDDEEADPDWLAHLLEEREKSGASVILGPVVAAYSNDAPGWLKRLDPHSTKPVHVKGQIRTGYSCNVLIDLSDPAFQGLRFDLALGRSGGEDTAFFTRAARNGARFAEASSAVVREKVTDHRATFKWLAKRRFRSGQTHGRLLGDGASAGIRIAEIGLAALKTAYCLGAAAIALPDKAKRNGAILRGVLHIGTISGLIGTTPITLYGTSENGAAQ